MNALLVPVTIGSKYFNFKSDEDFYKFCQEQGSFKVERQPNGDIKLMSPNYPEASKNTAEITFQLKLWNRKHKQGHVLESSAGFTLPNGAVRSPDCSWVSEEKWKEAIKAKKGFPHVCPEFVVQIKSPSDKISDLQAKMEEWMENGSLLGWLIDVKRKKVYIYRKGGTKETKGFSEKIKGEEILPGFSLNTEELQ